MYAIVMTGLLLFPWTLLGVSIVGALAHRLGRTGKALPRRAKEKSSHRSLPGSGSEIVTTVPTVVLGQP